MAKEIKSPEELTKKLEEGRSKLEIKKQEFKNKIEYYSLIRDEFIAYFSYSVLWTILCILFLTIICIFAYFYIDKDTICYMIIEALVFKIYYNKKNK